MLATFFYLQITRFQPDFGSISKFSRIWRQNPHFGLIFGDQNVDSSEFWVIKGLPTTGIHFPIGLDTNKQPNL